MQSFKGELKMDVLESYSGSTSDIKNMNVFVLLTGQAWSL